MKINTALILCAGFGKRLNPITLNTPKPLLEINDVSMLERCINLIKKLGIQKILINTFYLKDQFSVFLNSKNFNIDIKIIEDGEHILDTGGGIQNMIKDTNENDFLIFNPDTIWCDDYKDEILKMEKMYFSGKLEVSAYESIDISLAVVSCALFGNPEAFLKFVFVIPKFFA